MVLLHDRPQSVLDVLLVRRASAGDSEAFGALMDRYGDAVRRLVRRFVRDTDDARDVEQDTWIRAAAKLDSLEDEERFQPWVKAIARNTSLNYLSSRKRLGERVTTFEACGAREFEDDASPTPEASLLSQESQRKVWLALGSLSDRDRQILYLREHQGMPHEEVGAQLGISRNAAEVGLHRAKERFRKAYLAVERSVPPCGIDSLRLSTMLDGEGAGASEATRRDLQAHLDRCEGCRDRLATMSEGRALYRHLGALGLPLTEGGTILGWLGGLLAKAGGLLGWSAAGTGGAAATGAATGGAVAGGGVAAGGAGALTASVSGIAIAATTAAAITVGVAFTPDAGPRGDTRLPHVTQTASADTASAGPSAQPADGVLAAAVDAATEAALTEEARTQRVAPAAADLAPSVDLVMTVTDTTAEPAAPLAVSPAEEPAPVLHLDAGDAPPTGMLVAAHAPGAVGAASVGGAPPAAASTEARGSSARGTPGGGAVSTSSGGNGKGPDGAGPPGLARGNGNGKHAQAAIAITSGAGAPSASASTADASRATETASGGPGNGTGNGPGNGPGNNGNHGNGQNNSHNGNNSGNNNGNGGPGHNNGNNGNGNGPGQNNGNGNGNGNGKGNGS